MLRKQFKKKFCVGITMGKLIKKVLKRLKMLGEELVINQQEIKCMVIQWSISLVDLLRTLRKKTQRAVKIFRLLRRIGVDKIKWVISYSANAISKLTTT